MIACEEKQSRAENNKAQLRKLQRIDAGLYIDGTGGCYLCVSEFLVASRLPDKPEIREMLREEVSLGYPAITCIELI